MTRFVTRPEDMSPTGQLHIFKQEDGDVIVSIVGAVDHTGKPIKVPIVGVEFCSTGGGGGRSQQTLDALRNLYQAMKNDNENDGLGETVERDD